MKYNKPTIEVLGEAAVVIQSGKQNSLLDNNFSQPTPTPPAYDLDE